MGFYMGTWRGIYMEHTSMKIPELIREKVVNMVIERNQYIVAPTVEIGDNNGKAENIKESSSSKKGSEKKRKIRMCNVKGTCPFKNVWTYADRCYATFSVWNTCLHKGEERKV